METLTAPRSATFGSFQYPNFRLWFAGQLVSLIGTWTQQAALGFLIFTLTHSSTYLGAMALASGVPTAVLLLYGGVVADRIPRRKLIMSTQMVKALLAFTLTALVFSNHIEPWMLLVISFFTGTASAFEIPARHSLVTDLVDHDHLANAIALNVTMFNIAMIAGPALGGLIYATLGPGWCFAINGISYLAVIVALSLMQITNRETEGAQPSAAAAIRNGIEYVRNYSLIRGLTLNAFFYNIFDSAMIVFIPAFAVKLLNGNSTTNGLLLALNAGGAVLGGLILAASSKRFKRGKILAISAWVTPVMIAGFAVSRQLLPALFFTFVIGITSITVMNNLNTLIQSNVDDELRGRVMSIYALMTVGGGPAFTTLLGIAADKIGVFDMTLLCAALALIFAVQFALTGKKIRDCQ